MQRSVPGEEARPATVTRPRGGDLPMSDNFCNFVINMQRLLYHILPLLLTLISVSACSSDDTPDAPPPAEAGVSRTVLVYMIANNNLGSHYNSDNSDISEMLTGVKGGRLNGGRLLVYHNRPNRNGGTSNPPQLLDITEKGMKELKTYTDADGICSVSPERFRQVIADMKSIAPADEYALVLWGHGNGWIINPSDIKARSFGPDGSTWISLPAMARALEGERFAFIYFDCCLMGNIEPLYEMRRLTDIIVASPTQLGIDGMPYDMNVPLFFAEEPDLVQAAKNTFDSYRSFQNQMCVVDTRHLDDLAAASRDIFRTLAAYPAAADVDRLQKLGQYKVMYQSYTIAHDMDQYMEMLCTAAGRTDLLEEWRQILDSTVIYKASTETSIDYPGIPITRYCGLGSYVIREAGDITFREYDTLAWWKDVVSAAPAYSAK